MTTPTVAVTIKLADFGGPAIAGVEVKARMSDVDFMADGTIVSSHQVTGTTDATGTVVLQCFPNDVSPNGLGTRGTTTSFRANIPGSRSLNVMAVIPNQACNLVDIIVEEAPTPPVGYVTEQRPQSLTNKELVNPAFATVTLTDGAIIDWDASEGQTAALTLSTVQATRVLNNPTNLKDGALYSLLVTQSAAGGQGITTFGSAYVLNGLTIRSAADSVTVMMFLSLGGKLYAVNIGAGSSGGTITPPTTNNPPVNTVPGAQVTGYETALTFNGANGNLIEVDDADDDNLTTTITATGGTLTAATGSGATITNNGTSSVTIAGTIAAVNASLFGLVYTPPTGFSGGAILTVVTSDGIISDTDTIAVSVAAFSGNHPPVNTVPGTQSVPHDTTLVFSVAEGNPISVADADDDPLTVTVSVDTGGTLTATVPVMPELITNGTFDSNITGWSRNGGSHSWVAGALRSTGTGGSYQDVAVEVGKSYVLTVDYAAVSGSGVATLNIYQGGAFATPISTGQSVLNPLQFTAPTASARIYIHTSSTLVGDYDNVSLTEVAGADITDNGTDTVVIEGSVEDVNLALEGMVFTPTGGFSGAVTLTVLSDDGTDTDSDNITLNVAGTAGSQADTVQPLAVHTGDYLQIGNFWVVDGRWGWRSSDTSQEPDLTEGPASYQFRQKIERSLIVNPEDDSVACRWQISWPQFNALGHAIDGNSFYSEVKTYPSIIFGKKPGYFGSSMWPAFSYAVRAPDGATEPTPNPSFTPQPIKDTWQPLGGSVIQTFPTGATPGTGTTIMPMQLPLTGKTCRMRGKFQHNAVATGKGHLSYDIWLTATGPQVQGHVQSSLTHEIMIPLDYWGSPTPYGSYPNRNPSWYDHDVTIDGVLFHVYCTKRLGRNPTTGVYDGNPGSGLGYYPGLQYTFGGLDTVNHYTNEETGSDRVGWKLIVFEPDDPADLLDVNGYFNIDATKFIAHLAVTEDERGIPFIQNTEYLASMELGVELIWGDVDITLYNYMVQVANSVVAAPPLPTWGNHTPVNTVPAAQTATADADFTFSTANSNTITVLDLDNDPLTTIVSVDTGGVLTVVTGGGATITANGTASVTIEGTGTQINAALDGMVFTPTAAFEGDVVLNVLTDDGTVTDSDDVTITVVAASTAPTLIQAQFTAGNGGTWLHNDALTAFYTDGSGSTNPSGWTDLIGRWINHGAANGHDLLQTDNANRFLLGTDGDGKHFAGCYNGAPMVSTGGSTTAFYAALAVDVVSPSYDCVLLSDRLTANTGITLEQEAFNAVFYAKFGTGGGVVTCTTPVYAAGSNNPAGKVLLELWYDGTDCAVRLNKGTTDSHALASLSAGQSSMLLLGNYPLSGSVTSNNSTANVYECVVFKNYCPNSTDRDIIATWVAQQAGLTV